MLKISKDKFITKSDGFYYGDKYIADFYVRVIKKIKYKTITGDLIRKEYILKAVFPDGSETSEITVSNIENVKYSDYWDRCIDKKYSSEQKKYLVIYMQEQLVDIPWETTVEIKHTGWQRKGVYAFCQDEVISSDSSATYVTKGELPVYNIGNEIDEEKMKGYIIRLLRFYPTVTDVLFLFRCLSILKPIFSIYRGIKLDMVCSLTGKSGSLKTSLSEIMLNDEKAEIKLMSAKVKDIEKALHYYQGGFVLFDDYKNVNQSHIKDRMKDILDLLTRMADQNDTAMVAITSEFLEGDFSFQDRLIQINVQKGRNEYTEEQIQELTFFQQNKEIIDYFWYDFAKRVYLNIEKVNSIIEEYSDTLNKKTRFRIERNINALSIACIVFVEVYRISKGEIGYNIAESLVRLEERQKEHMYKVYLLEYEQDWVTLVYNAFKEKCIDIKSCCYHDKEYLLIQGKALERGMNRYLQTQCRIKEIIDDFEEKDLLYQDSTKDRTVKRKGKRYYMIDSEKVLDYMKSKHKSTIETV